MGINGLNLKKLGSLLNITKIAELRTKDIDDLILKYFESLIENYSEDFDVDNIDINDLLEMAKQKRESLSSTRPQIGIFEIPELAEASDNLSDIESNVTIQYREAEQDVTNTEQDANQQNNIAEDNLSTVETQVQTQNKEAEANLSKSKETADTQNQAAETNLDDTKRSATEANEEANANVETATTNKESAETAHSNAEETQASVKNAYDSANNAVMQANSNLENAQAALSAAETDEEKKAAQAKVTEAENALKAAQQELENQKKALDDANSALDNAKDEVEKAEQALSESKETQEQVKQEGEEAVSDAEQNVTETRAAGEESIANAENNVTQVASDGENAINQAETNLQNVKEQGEESINTAEKKAEQTKQEGEKQVQTAEKELEAVGENIRKEKETDEIVTTEDGQEHNLNQIINDRLDSVSEGLETAKNNNTVIGETWDDFKNFTGIGTGSDDVSEANKKDLENFSEFDNNVSGRAETFKELTGEEYTDENKQKFVKGELKTKSEVALQEYKEGQEEAVDTIADIGAGISAFGVGAATSLTGVGAVAAAAATGATVKAGIKGLDAATSDSKDYTASDMAYDLSSGAVTGALAPISNVAGGAVKKTVANAITSTSRSAAEEAAKTAIGKAAGRAAGAMTEGAIDGGGTGAFQAAYNGENIIEGTVKGAAIGATVGSAFDGLATAGSKATKKLTTAIGSAQNQVAKASDNISGLGTTSNINNGIGGANTPTNSSITGIGSQSNDLVNMKPTGEDVIPDKKAQGSSTPPASIDENWLDSIREDISMNNAKKQMTNLTQREIDYLKAQEQRIARGEPKFLCTPEEREILYSIKDKNIGKLFMNRYKALQKAPADKIDVTPLSLSEKDKRLLHEYWDFGSRPSTEFNSMFNRIATTLPEDVTLYRGLCARESQFGEDIEKQLNSLEFLNSVKEGAILKADNKYLSTTNSASWADGYGPWRTMFGAGYVLKINVPKGTKVLDMRHERGNYSRTDAEFVLPRNTEIKVLNVDHDSLICECELIYAQN